MKLAKISIITIFVLVVFSPKISNAQLVEYKIHDRGMLHETVYNDGVIARPWQEGPGGEVQNLPSFEWPRFSSTIINGLEYSGHHNAVGAGMYVSANQAGIPGRENRTFSFCGGIGTTAGTELPAGRWSFPISIEEIENFPLTEDGELNPDYNPDEAEEIIIAKWATSTGITVTRTSRAWSYPDYDDMIIYEYVLEYTGDTDGDESTQERDFKLEDVLFHINYGFSPSMLGYQRNYGEWKYEQGMYRMDQRSSFDPDYWLTFMQTVRTGASDNSEYLMAKPEPDKELFKLFAETGLNGGGLLSPQAPGYCWLYWETDHLAYVAKNDPNNESDYANFLLKDGSGQIFELDDNGHVKQPWNMKTGSGNTRVDKMEDRAATMDERWWTVYGETTANPGFPSDGNRYILPGGREWLGRARYEWDEAYNGVQVINGFGPYTMEIGDKLEFSYAEVVGYGGTPGKVLCGGGDNDGPQFRRTRDLDKEVIIDGEVMTENYLTDYGYPDYINSDVISVNQVAHNAWEAYLGEEIEYDASGTRPASGTLFPEDNPRPSSNTEKYKNIPMPFPAPVIIVENTEEATVKVTWNRAVENFSNSRLIGQLDKFNIYRSLSKSGPWDLLATINIGEVNDIDLYEYIDEDETFRLGESRAYAVASVDEFGNESGLTNITDHVKNVKNVDVMTDVYAVPNPFINKSGFADASDEGKIGFYGLPEVCTIRIYSYAGQLVETIEHNSPTFSEEYFQVSRNDQDLASGIYFYVVTTPDGDTANGKLIIIK